MIVTHLTGDCGKLHHELQKCKIALTNNRIIIIS